MAEERRLKAAKLAGITRIPAIITSGNPAEIALIENLQREDLKPMEEAKGYARILTQYRYKQNELAKIVGKGRSTVSEILTLNKLPLAIRKQCRTSDIPKNVLLEIAKQPSNEKMATLFKRAKESNFTVATIRQLTRKKPENHKANNPNSIILNKIHDHNNSEQNQTRHLQRGQKEGTSH